VAAPLVSYAMIPESRTQGGVPVDGQLARPGPTSALLGGFGTRSSVPDRPGQRATPELHGSVLGAVPLAASGRAW
jgi:hypothetical protein